VKNAVIFGLLFYLVTLNLPKSFFHSHNHHENHTENKTDFSFSLDEADCFVCDIDLSNFSFSTHHAIQFDPKANVHGKEQVYFLEKSNHYDFQHLRGPPTNI
jgi:hypothetical protein